MVAVASVYLVIDLESAGQEGRMSRRVRAHWRMSRPHVDSSLWTSFQPWGCCRLEEKLAPRPELHTSWPGNQMSWWRDLAGAAQYGQTCPGPARCGSTPATVCVSCACIWSSVLTFCVWTGCDCRCTSPFCVSAGRPDNPGAGASWGEGSAGKCPSSSAKLWPFRSPVSHCFSPFSRAGLLPHLPSTWRS